MTSLGQTLAALKAHRNQAPANRGRLRVVEGFGSNPGQLRMRAYSPTSRGPNAPLVVVLHGCTQTAESYADPVGWLDLADRFGFVVVAPEQRRPNNPNLCFNWYETGDIQRGGGEAESIAQMVSHAVNAWDLEARQVFITGLSAGGAMTSVMLATYPDLFAGGAIVAGLPYGVAASVAEALEAMSGSSRLSPDTLGDLVLRTGPHRGPWPAVSVWHGQSDTLVRPAAGEAVAAQWRSVHRADEVARTARTPGGREFLVWMSSDGEPVVELHRIDGLGHGAAVKASGPGGCGRHSQYTPEAGVSSSFEIALGWGLAERSSDAEWSAAGSTVDTAPGVRSPSVVSDGVSKVINDAFRAAGLLA